MRSLKIFICCTVICALFMSCSPKTPAPMTSNQQQTSDNNIVADRSSAYSTVSAYLSYIKAGDYYSARDLINLTDGTFLSSEDLEYVLRRSLLSGIVGNPNGIVLEDTFKESSGTASLDVFTDNSYSIDKLYTIDLLLNEDNEWSINPIGLVKEVWTCFTPADVRLFLNGIEVDEKYKLKTENSLDYYVIPEIARRDFNTEIISSIFGSIKGSVQIPEYNRLVLEMEEKPYEINRTIVGELFSQVTLDIKNIYNQVYIHMDNLDAAENITPLLHPSRSYRLFEVYYQSGIDTRKSLTAESTPRYMRTEVLEIMQNPDVISYVFSKDTIVVNIILSLRWENTTTGMVESEKIITAVKVKKSGATWLLDDIRANGWNTLQNGLIENTTVETW